MSPSHAAKPERNMFSGLKSRLGFSNDSYEQYSDEEYGEGYEEFEEYGESYETESDRGSYGGGSASGSYGSAYDPTSRVSYSSRRAGVSSPPLVSFSDVKARTQVPDSLMRDPLATRPTYSSDRTMVEASNLHHPSSPNGRAAAAASQNGGDGAERLGRSDFGTSGSTSVSTSPAASAGSASSSGYDPYDAYAGRSAGSHIPSRSLKIIRPMQYGDVESVAKAIKAGDAVILALTATPESLAKRVLDFSFGVASALDASVDCVSAKVFAITRNGALTQAEKTNLKNQGIL